MSIKVKLAGVFLALLSFDFVYFYENNAFIGELNGIALDLYDKVVMSTNYAQLVKIDLHTFSESEARVLAGDASGATARDEAATSFRDDLAVVRERLLDEKMTADLDRLLVDFEKLARSARPSSVRAWYDDETRTQILTRASELADRIVADGYDFRVRAKARTAQVRWATVAFAIAMLVFNALGSLFIWSTVLPRLRRLTEVCAEIAAGNFGRRVDVRSKDEFGELADSFNLMLGALAKSEGRVQEQLATTGALVEGLGQGFFMIDRTHRCLDVVSNACLDLLEDSPARRPAADALRVPAEDREAFEDWLDLIFAEAANFESLSALGPAFFPHSAGRIITLEYKPSRDARGALAALVVVATDKTLEVRALSKANREEDFSKILLQLMRNRVDFKRFVHDARNMINALRDASPSLALRLVHTIKGGAATFAMGRFKEVAHERERILIEASEADFARERKESAERLHQSLAEILTELADQAKIRLDEDEQVRELPTRALLEFAERLPAGGLRDEFLRQFLYDAFGGLVAGFNETVRHVAARQGKRVRDLVVSGGDERLPRDAYADLLSSLVHVFRNAVDHGIETPEERVQAGKDPVATIRVRLDVNSEPGRLRLTISDDGRGLDVAKLRERLEERGLDITRLNDEVVAQHVFDAGLSTRDGVTDISGRGVGLDAVRDRARALGGDARVEWVAGQSTTIVIEVDRHA